MVWGFWLCFPRGYYSADASSESALKMKRLPQSVIKYFRPSTEETYRK